MDTYKLKGGKYLKVIQDENAADPRDWDNLGTMACFHKRYSLGDKDRGYDSKDYNSWKEMFKAIAKKNAIILPLYLYDHSGITISTKPFSCPWDSGQIGFIFISREKILEEYNRKHLSQKLLQRITTYLEGEVETYDQFLTGDVYGFKVYENEEALDEDEDEDSCWGFFGSDPKKNGMLDHIAGELEEA